MPYCTRVFGAVKRGRGWGTDIVTLVCIVKKIFYENESRNTKQTHDLEILTSRLKTKAAIYYKCAKVSVMKMAIPPDTAELTLGEK